MDKVLATRLGLSMAIIVAYIVAARYNLNVPVVAPILIVLLVLVLFVPVRSSASKRTQAPLNDDHTTPTH